MNCSLIVKLLGKQGQKKTLDLEIGARGMQLVGGLFRQSHLIAPSDLIENKELSKGRRIQEGRNI